MSLMSKKKTKPKRGAPGRPLPEELWLLRDTRGNFVVSMEADDEKLPLLAMQTEREAQLVAAEHETLFGVPCRPVKVI